MRYIVRKPRRTKPVDVRSDAQPWKVPMGLVDKSALSGTLYREALRRCIFYESFHVPLPPRTCWQRMRDGLRTTITRWTPHLHFGPCEDRNDEEDD